MISAEFSGKSVIVTGGASGIGLAAVRRFAACGARVVLNHLPNDSRGPAEVEGLKAEGLDVVAVAGDVSDAHGGPRMINSAIDTLGGLDVLINNAGTSNTRAPVPFEDLDAMTDEFWSRIMETNLLGAFRCARTAGPALTVSSGVIVNTASVAGLGRRGSSVAYCASKAALINLTSSLARALAPRVRVNAVAPGLVNSPWTKPWPAERKERSIEASLLKRMVEPDEIADAMLFLSAASAVTGQTLVVDCGVV